MISSRACWCSPTVDSSATTPGPPPATGAELLWRVSDVVDLPVVEWLPDGSYRAELLPKDVKKDLKRGRFRNVAAGARIPVRVIEYMVTNRGEETETIRLITTIGDHELAPAGELAAL